MSYRLIGIGAVCIVVATATSTGAQAPGGILGTYNPATGAFQPVTVQSGAPANTVEPRAAVARSGSIRFRIVIKVRSGSPAATLPSCSLSFSHSGVLHSYNEGQGLTGTRTANSALCDLTIPYSWPQANNANPVNLSIFVNVGNRSHSESLAPIPLPPDGATKTIIVQVTA